MKQTKNESKSHLARGGVRMGKKTKQNSKQKPKGKLLVHLMVKTVTIKYNVFINKKSGPLIGHFLIIQKVDINLWNGDILNCLKSPISYCLHDQLHLKEGLKIVKNLMRLIT